MYNYQRIGGKYLVQNLNDSVLCNEKILLKTDNLKQLMRLWKRPAFLESLQDSNIIKFFSSFFDDESSTLNIIMEYVDGGDL